MRTYFLGLNPILQALVAGIFTWFMTAVGASVVLGTKKINRKLLDAMLGFSAGIMLAACFWSLLMPGFEMARQMGMTTWITASVGFMSGGIFMRIFDRFLPHIHPGLFHDRPEGGSSSWRRSMLLVVAITIHNIPEGLALGIAFGALASGAKTATLGAALALTLGIGIQDIPEGTAVSLPLRREGLKRWKSFMLGQYSGLVEPLAAMVGAAFVIYINSLLPYALFFSAGAMLFVVIEGLIPESQRV
ncbi:MAG: ZIP family metal transporter, partial [Proteobacteria bacterium]|nr:ZIP family metal transporter [Pseudomonadota bacterium]